MGTIRLNLPKVIVIGILAGTLFWLSFGDSFWRGFLAGLVVEEVVQLSPWLTDLIILHASKSATKDPDEQVAKHRNISERVEEFPGRLVRLLGAIVIAIPLLGRGILNAGGARLVGARRIAKITAVTSIRVLAIVATIAVFLGPPIFMAISLIENIQAPGPISTGNILSTATGIPAFFVGAISVLMIIVGGLRYVTSGGDSGAVTSAKNTILYAIIGLFVAALTFTVAEVISVTLL